MTDQLPERILLAPTINCKEPDDYYVVHPAVRDRDAQEYLRADTAIPKPEADAMVAAAWLAASDICRSWYDAAIHEGTISDEECEAYRFCAEEIAKLTPADARAAFDRAVQEAVEVERSRCAKILAEYCGSDVSAMEVLNDGTT